MNKNWWYIIFLAIGFVLALWLDRCHNKPVIAPNIIRVDTITLTRYIDSTSNKVAILQSTIAVKDIIIHESKVNLKQAQNLVNYLLDSLNNSQPDNPIIDTIIVENNLQEEYCRLALNNLDSNIIALRAIISLKDSAYKHLHNSFDTCMAQNPVRDKYENDLNKAIRKQKATGWLKGIAGLAVGWLTGHKF